MKKKEKIVIFSGLIDAQIFGNQSFTQTIIGLSRLYEVHIFNVMPRDIPNVAYDAFQSLDVHYHRPARLIGELISNIKAFRGKKRLEKKIEHTNKIEKISTDPLADYSLLQLNVLGLIYVITSIYMFFSAILKIKIVRDAKIIYGYEISGIYTAVAIGLIFWKKHVFRRFQGVSIPVNNIWSMRTFFHSIAFFISRSPIIMADDGTRGNIIANKLCKNAKLFFMRNGLDKSFIELLLKEKADLQNKSSIDENFIRIIALSKLKKWKRVDRCINFCDYYSKKLSRRIHLTIVGDGDELNILKNKVKDLNNILLQVSFEGAVARKSIPRKICENDCLISFYSVSNAGNPLFEAYASGLNIITFDDGSLPYDIVQSNGVILIAPFDDYPSPDSDIVVEKLFNNVKQRFSDRNIFTWEARMEMEIDFINKCISS